MAVHPGGSPLERLGEIYRVPEGSRVCCLCLTRRRFWESGMGFHFERMRGMDDDDKDRHFKDLLSSYDPAGPRVVKDDLIRLNITLDYGGKVKTTEQWYCGEHFNKRLDVSLKRLLSI